MPLTNRIRIVTKKFDKEAPKVKWANTYDFTTAAELETDEARGLVELVIDAERVFHLDRVRFAGGYATRYRAKVIVPNPAPPPLDPTDLVEYTDFGYGMRSIGEDDAMSIDHIMQANRETDFGRLGWVEYRGALKEAEVKQALGGLSGEDEFTIDGFIDAFNTAMQTAATSLGGQWVKRSEPQLTKVPTIVGTKVKWTRTYGPTVETQIKNFAYFGIRIDDHDHGYFDTGS